MSEWDEKKFFEKAATFFREESSIEYQRNTKRERHQEGVFKMEQTVNMMWRIWVDTKNRIVSFHEAEGCQMMEFRSHEMFLSYVDEFTGRHYRYQ